MTKLPTKTETVYPYRCDVCGRVVSQSIELIPPAWFQLGNDHLCGGCEKKVDAWWRKMHPFHRKAEMLAAENAKLRDKLAAYRGTSE